MDDDRTTDELFAASLEGDYEDEAAWAAVAADLLELNRDVPVENLRKGLHGLLAQTNHPARP
jgi:hypothetical protein